MVTRHAVLGALALLHLSWAADPANVAAFRGSDVTITCSDDSAVDSKSWKKGGTTIVSGNGQPSDSNKYSITKNGGSYNLGIKNVRTADAREYVCGGSTDKRAYLVVAENLQCDVTSAGYDQVNVKCMVQYGGAWAPSCAIKKNNQAVSAESATTANNQYSREASMVAVISTDEITCSLSMTSAGRPGNVPPNVPAFTPQSDATKTQTMTPPNVPQLVPLSKTDFMEGNTLTCLSTVGNPKPAYNWTIDSSGEFLANTSTIKMTPAMSGQVLRCKAYNSVGEQAVTLNVTSVTATTTTEAPTGVPTKPGKDFAPACKGNSSLLAVVCVVIRILSRP